MAGTVGLIEALEDASTGRSQYDIFQGWAYSTGSINENVSSGNSVNHFIENPSDSGNFVTVQTRFLTSGEFFVSKIDSVTKTASGTSEAINNRLMSQDGASITSESNISFSGGNSWTQKVAGGGDGAASVQGTITPESEVILEEGDNILLKATNKTTSEQDVSIDIDFFEVPLTEVDEI